jgi:sugar O-acyltransferase (sialic acid O-acetyltransferase NeuD family)
MSHGLPIILIGGGGHAKVVIETCRYLGRTVLGFTDPDVSRPECFGIKRLGDDAVLAAYGPADVELANGIGSVSLPLRRAERFRHFRERGFRFASVIHPSAIIAESARLGEGVQVMAGVVIQPSARLGDNVLVNTRASIDHDTVVGDHTHIGPGAVLCGNVHLGEACHVGAGACIIQSVVVGANSLVGAGAVVLRHVPAGSRAWGVPARIVNP